MAEGFAELGLTPALVRALMDAGITVPTSLQRATIPVVRRGGNAVLHASAGAGVTLAWAAPLLDRLATSRESGPQDAGGNEVRAVAPSALVVTATDEHASRLAGAVAPLATATGLALGALSRGWAEPGTNIEVLIAPVDVAVERVRTSALKLDRVEAFALLSASAVVALAGADSLEALTASLPREAQRVVTSGEVDAGVEDLVERHVRKALWIPPRQAEAEAGVVESADRGAALGFMTAADGQRLDRLAGLLGGDSVTAPVVVFCRTDDRSADVAQGLAIRGFRVGRAGEEGVQVVVAAAGADPASLGGGTPVSYDVPFDEGQLVSRHGRAGGIVLVGPRELPHLRRIAREAGAPIRPFHGAAAAEQRTAGPISSYRERLRRAAAEEDLEAQLLVLGPLVEELSPLELAAAASALLRQRGAVSEARSQEAVPVLAGPAAATAKPGTKGAPRPRAFVRLFVSLGERDRIRPGDLVGAIAGEAGVPGGDVGKIEVRETFSIVEVPQDVAERVIRSLNGTTVKGRSVRVDYDRKAGGVPGPRPSGPPRTRHRPSPRGGRGER